MAVSKRIPLMVGNLRPDRSDVFWQPSSNTFLKPNERTKPMTEDRVTIRLSVDDAANVATIAAALTDGTLRPHVSTSDAVRSALRIAAGSLTLPTAGTLAA